MAEGYKRNNDEASGKSDADRYESALAYVRLDRTHRKRSKWSTIMAAALVVLAISLIMLAVIGFSYLQGQHKYDKIAESADLTTLDRPLAEAEINIDWDALHATNPDTVAWLYIPGTAINYPVVRGDDNEYYLNHDFTGDQGWLANFGAIFLDYRNSPDWSDQAYFMYGHHMNDGSMFADIASLSDQARFDASRTVYVLSPNGNFKLRTFSLIHCSDDDPLVQISFANAQDMVDYVKDKISRSIVSVGNLPSATEITKTFAFATCDNFSSGRYVLYAYVEQQVGTSTSRTSKVDLNEQSQSQSKPIGDIPAEEKSSSSSAAAQDEEQQSPDEASSGDDEASQSDGEDDAGYSEDDELDSGAEEYADILNAEYDGGHYVYEDGDLRWIPDE